MDVRALYIAPIISVERNRVVSHAKIDLEVWVACEGVSRCLCTSLNEKASGLKERVDEGKGAGSAQNNEQAKHQHDKNDGRNPPDLLFSNKLNKLKNNRRRRLLFEVV